MDSAPLIPTKTRPEGIALDIISELVSILDIETAIRLGKVNRSWRCFLRSTDGCAPFRHFTAGYIPTQLREGTKASQSRLLLGCWDLVKTSGGFIALHIPSSLTLRTQLLMEMIECSAPRLQSLEIVLLPWNLREDAGPHVPLNVNVEEVDWAAVTWDGNHTYQDRLDGAVHRILMICSKLRHLGIQCLFEDPSARETWTITHCERLVLPPDAYQLVPSLRSLKLRDVRPVYAPPLFELAKQLESLEVSGSGLEGEDDYKDFDDHMGVMSPTALRVLLRFLGLGTRIQHLVIQEPFDYASFAASSLFDGLDAGVIDRGEIDPRWSSRRDAESAMREQLTGTVDLLRDRESSFYALPPKVYLPHLETLHVNAVHVCYNISDTSANEVANARMREIAQIVTPKLTEVLVDNPTPALSDLFESVPNSVGVRRLSLRRPDVRNISYEALRVMFESLTALEILSFDFTHPRPVYFGAYRHFLIPELLPLIDDSDAVLPNLRMLELVNDEWSSGANLVSFVRQRQATATRGMTDHSRGLDSLQIRTTSQYKATVITDVEKLWLKDNLDLFDWSLSAWANIQ